MLQPNELIAEVNRTLEAFNYVEDPDAGIPDLHFVSYVRNPPILKVRNACAVVDLPANIVDAKVIKRFFEFIRKAMLDKYGDAFLWKELEILFVVLCEHPLYLSLKEIDGRVIDETSFSLSAILGAVFIDKENFDTFAHSSFGVYFSGNHFKTLNNSMVRWCGEQKKKQ